MILISCNAIIVIYVVWSFLTPLYNRSFLSFLSYYIVTSIIAYFLSRMFNISRCQARFIIIMFVASIIAWVLGNLIFNKLNVE